MSTDENRSSVGGASDQERAHVDPATDRKQSHRKQSQSYLHRIALGVAFLGAVCVAAAGGTPNGLFVIGWGLALGGVLVACVTGKEVPDE